MSYHIVHILQHGSRLHVDRGCLICRVPDREERKLPLDDILIVVVAARGVSFSSNTLSELVSHQAVVLHCGENYRPVGKTAPLGSVIHTGIVAAQTGQGGRLSDSIWNAILAAKVSNQARLLDRLKTPHQLWEYLRKKPLDEGNAARHYWKRYFSVAFKGEGPSEREYRQAEHPVNKLLNYGYAVLGAIVHRSIAAHGMLAAVGIHHRSRFKGDPLVYDLVEPLRPFCDMFLERLFAEKARKGNMEMDEWVKTLATGIVSLSIPVGEKSVKLVHAMDRYVASVADCFLKASMQLLFIPELPEEVHVEKEETG